MKKFFGKKAPAEPAMAIDKSIYAQIKRAIEPDGLLSQKFHLGAEPQPGQICFAPGAMDGIILYHSGGGVDAALLTDLQQLTRQVTAGLDFAAAEAQLTACFERRAAKEKSHDKIVGSYDGMLGCIDALQEWILQNREELPPQPLFDFAVQVLRHSGSVGALKYALSVLELLAQAEGDWRGLLHTLALCDEFTLYCVFVARQWENANQEIWQMAQCARGWGRVHAVAELEPETSAIQEWLLDEGWRNGVLAAYSALQCTLKGDLAARLQRPDLTPEQLNAAAGLLAGLLDEGPFLGISDERLSDPAGLLGSFLAQARRLNYVIERELLQDIIGVAAEHGWPELQTQAESILADYPAAPEQEIGE